MLITTKKLTKHDSMSREVKFDLFVLRCDTCSREFEKRGAASRITKRTSHYCSKECVREACKDGGKLAKVRGKTNIERYGVSNVFASDDVKESIRQTMLERYGVERALQSEESIAKMQATMLERYGAKSPTHVPKLRQKQLNTMLERHGVAYPMQLESVKEKMRKGCVAKYGVSYILQNKEAHKKVMESLFESYRKADGRVQSKPELKLKAALIQAFGNPDIHQKRLGRWWADFKITVGVKTVYIEVDGEYWHGLNGVTMSKLKPDSGHLAAIKAKIKRDQAVEAYCQANSITLVRFASQKVISDVEDCVQIVRATLID